MLPYKKVQLIFVMVVGVGVRIALPARMEEELPVELDDPWLFIVEAFDMWNLVVYPLPSSVGRYRAGNSVQFIRAMELSESRYEIKKGERLV